MADRWTPIDGPGKGDAYNWRVPSNEHQHQEQTVAPGDFMIRPEDVDLKPTNSPKRSGIQHGQDDWNYENAPDPDWNINLGEITDGFDYYFDIPFD